MRIHPAWTAALAPAASLAMLAALAPSVLEGGAIRLSLAWFPDLGVRYALVLDGLAFLFTALILGVGLLVFVYTTAYMPRQPELGRFCAFLLLFMGAMLGVVLADDLVVLYIFWELTSLASFFLIGYRNEDPAARAGATQALVVTVAGGLAMLAGIVLLAQVGGSWQLSALAAKAVEIRASPAYPAILALVLVGAFTKSAQVPFQFWLPTAMVAPTPVSTYLHAATMVWAGVYLLARLLPALGGTALWTAVVTPVGLATLIAGAGLALVQDDLKALLAYSTVGALGLATALVGWATPVAVAAAIVHVLNHAAYKGTLFLVAGAVEHETGTRAITRLGGLGRAMPITAAVSVTAALSMAGLPPLGGFLSKEAAVDAFLHGSWPAAAAVVLSGALSLAYGARFLRIFFGPRPAAPARPGHPPHTTPTSRAEAVHEPPLLLWAPAAVLALAGLVFGLAPAILERLAGLAAAATAATVIGGTAIAGTPQPVALWHGVTGTVAAVTGLTVAGGLLALWRQAAALRARHRLAWLSAGALYDRLYAGTLGGAKALTSLYMTGRLRDYLGYMVLATLAVIAAGLMRTGITARVTAEGLEVMPALAVLVAMAAAAAAVRLRLLLAAVLALGVAGYSVSMVYLLLSAPDIAVTQAVIETISLVLFLVAITALARSEEGVPRERPITDGALALAVGAISAVLAAMVANLSDLPRVADAFFDHAAEAGGKNVVNLVIVDFRGWDTMGEISVLAIAALGIMALAPWRTVARAPGVAPGEAPMTSLILRTIAALVSPVIIAYAVLLWATGHSGPGGGFVAGLMTSGALVLRTQAFGPDRLTRRWDVVMAAGLLLAIGSAVVPLLVGKPLLQHTLLTVGTMRLASSLIFDAGVFCLVVGAVMAAVRSLVEAA